MNHVARLSLIAAVAMTAPAVASAGLLDKLNEAAKKMNEDSQQNAQQSPQGASAQSGGGSLSAALGATTVNRDFPNCMAQSSGSHEKLLVQVLQRKLNSGSTLTPQERQHIQEDIQYLSATASGARPQAPDPKNPQRYYLEMTDAEQMEASSTNNQYLNQVRETCEAAFGGMSQFADPSGRRRPVGNTVVPFPQLSATAPAAAPSPMDSYKNCMGSELGLRWKIIGDKLQQKMEAAGHLSAQERKAWEEDLAVVRTAQNGDGKTMPMSPDPKNPMRYMMRLSPQEQTAVNQEYAAASQQLMASCRGGGSSGAAQNSVTDSRAQELAAMHAQRAKDRNGPKANAGAANAEAQAWLAAHPFTPRAYAAGSATQADYMEKSGTLACYDRQKGFRAKQTADRLMTKRASVSAQDRQELEAWITAWRMAEQSGQDEPAPISPANTQGWLRFLTNVDQQELNMAYSALHNKVMAECNAMDHMDTGAKTY